MSVKCKDVMEIMETIAPRHLAFNWDNVGLLIGDENVSINSILVALDIDSDVVDEAVELGANLIITHHPVIFSPLKSVNIKNSRERIIHRIISHNINVYSAHTNLDRAEHGINDFLANIFDLTETTHLAEIFKEKLYKLAVYVPEGYEDKVREAMTDAGAGHIGNYRCCTFNIKGQGTFMPLKGSSPFIGSNDKLEHVREVKIETVISSNKLPFILEKMLQAHPYEEVAYDVYPLLNCKNKYGIGRAGYLKNAMSLRELCFKVKDMLSIDSLNVTGDLDRKVRKAAVCSGSGGDFISAAYDLGCDVYITGDIKYHDACDARDMGLCIIDAGHFATENIYMLELLNQVKNQLASKNSCINISLSKKNNNPYNKV